MTSSRGLVRMVVLLGWATLLAAAPLRSQDSTFLLTTASPTYRHPAYMGNGRFSMVSTPSGVGAAPSYLAGLYEHAPGDVPRIAALPAWGEIEVAYDSTRLGATPVSDSTLRAYRQTVNMYDGVLHTSYEWADGDRRTDVEVRGFVSRADPRLAAIELVLVPHDTGRMRISFTLRPWPAPHRLALGRLERTEPEWGNAELWYPGHMAVRQTHAERAAGGGRLWMTSVPEGRTTTLAQAVEAVWPSTLPGATTRAITTDSLVAVEVAFDAVPGTRYTFHKLVSIVSSKDAAAPVAHARASVNAARTRGFDALLRAHAAAWHALWETDIVVDGDPALQRTIHAMLFQLLGSVREGSAWSIPPMGLSSAGYYGHVFWDADTWMFPALVLAHPELARSMAMFRYETLGSAKRNARSNGYAGAMFPWEAGEFGEETTPRFAIQNARSEIHITGDVALAQWQYYLATGDSAWLARYGYPVIREAADFWVSRVTFDSARGRYDIRNVVSVDEGLIGITNDAYTNAVARKTLQVALDASERLKQKPSPRWRDVATRLYVPYDSAGAFHPTYEGAPPTTLGSVVPLLAYPLALPMNEQARRTDLEHAVRRLAKEGPGAMMTATLYPVVAAGLGDRALVDSLVPHTYRPYLRGPFELLAETPRNDAVSFVTGAGGFLQQVIYGYTGLRLTDSGVTPAFKPLLPSGITRLELRNFAVRGKRYDFIVEGDSLRTLTRLRASAPRAAARAEREQPPVLAFPDPALDDTAAYQGYQTRFYRDSRKNAVQMYLDGSSGRVVQLWADAADESAGFTVRDTAGRPTRLTWGSPGAVIADSAGGRFRTITYTLTAHAPRVEIGWPLLGSMRVERDFQYAQHHLKPFGAEPFRQQELVQLVANLRQLEPAEQQRQLVLLGARSISELQARLAPTLRTTTTDTSWTASILQPTLDGKNHLALALRVDPRQAIAQVTGRTITIRSRTARPVTFTVHVATDAAPLTPLARDEIFNRDFLQFLAQARTTHDSVLRATADDAPSARDSALLHRYRWLEREVRSVELLSAREKLMAGLPNYATYFGRDMMMSALMMQPIWRPEMFEHVIASVLRKLGPAGDVSHEEALGGQAIRENAAQYNTLMAERAARAQRGDVNGADSVLAAARALLANLQETRENYWMKDDELQLPVLAARYLADSAVSAARKRAFLTDTTSHGGTTRLALLLRELALVANETAPYARAPEARNLIAFVRHDSTHWRSASWRDSRAGYANGRFAMDINAIWAPRALASIDQILSSLRTLGFTPTRLDSLSPEIVRTPLSEYMRDSSAVRRAAEVWQAAGRHFVVALAPREVEDHVRARLAWLPAEQRSYWEGVIARNGGIRDSLTFLALSLDSAGAPIAVANTDPATWLFLGDLTGDVLRGRLRPEQVLRGVEVITRRYPVGLFVDSLGPLVANDAYASPAVWNAFREDSYHSPTVVWGREVNLFLLGLAKQIAAAYDQSGQLRNPALAPYVRTLRDALQRTMAAVEASGFKHSELWSYRIANGALHPMRYGISSDLQLWSSTDLAVQFMLSRLPHP